MEGEPCLALKLTLNFRVLIQPYSIRLINNFWWGGWALLSVSKLERQRTSGPEKRTKSDFIYCAQCYWLRSRKLDLPLSVNAESIKRWSRSQILIRRVCFFKGEGYPNPPLPLVHLWLYLVRDIKKAYLCLGDEATIPMFFFNFLAIFQVWCAKGWALYTSKYN